ncbi:MAG TPA: SPFH domain-containing protein [Solirubrobacteraceae bacterium]|jgi:regulator of protease activity HflC (stomatin/prohibitin superfamily)
MADRAAPIRRLAFAVAIGFGVLILAIASFGSFKSVPPGEICVIQEGGPFDGRGVKEVRQPSSGVSFIGAFNSQRCFPATERNYVLSADPQQSDREAVDFFETPTRDAVQVRIEGQALFRLSTAEDAVEQFYRRFGVRTFNGLHPYDGNEGWVAFLNVQFRPILENALRESIGQYRCVELNNTCAYVQNAEAAATGQVDDADNVQNLAEVQAKIAETLQRDLDETLGGKFFEGVRFRLVQVRFDPELQRSIVAATAARADVATRRLQAQQKVETAIGDRRVAEQKAAAIRATRNAYRSNPSQARIDAIRALPEGLQALGGGINAVVGR